MATLPGDATLTARAGRAIFASWAVIITTSLLLLTEVAEAMGLISAGSQDGGLLLAWGAIGIGYSIAFVGAVILVAMWIHRAHSNMREAGQIGEFTPGWAVGWYFVPIMNLFKPFQAMRELWNGSMGLADSFAAEAPGEVKAWWGAWIAGNLISNVSMRIGLMGDGSNLQVGAFIGAISSACIIAAGWLLIKLIREITEAQGRGLGVAQVFA